MISFFLALLGVVIATVATYINLLHQRIANLKAQLSAEEDGFREMEDSMGAEILDREERFADLMATAEQLQAEVVDHRKDCLPQYRCSY